MSNFKVAADDFDLAKFREANPRASEMLEELSRLPWLREVITSLKRQASKPNGLTPKQFSFISSLYLDSCVISDADIARQVSYRKIGFRLLKCRLGQTQYFINSVMRNTNTRPFSPAQMRAVDNVAKKNWKELSQVDDFDDNDFDGWVERQKGYQLTKE